MANLSNFPNEIDSFLKHYDLSATDIQDYLEYQQLKLKINRTPQEDDRMNTLLLNLRDKIFTADDLNKLQDAIVNLQTFFLHEVQSFVIETIDGTTAGALRADIGTMSDLKTVNKSSLVEAVNETKIKIQSTAPTSPAPHTCWIDTSI